jgi:hypothetical protein
MPRRSVRRAAFPVALVLACAAASSGCGAILGIDDGLSEGDASTDGTAHEGSTDDGAPDGTTTNDTGSDTAPDSSGGDSGMSGGDSQAESSTDTGTSPGDSGMPDTAPPPSDGATCIDGSHQCVGNASETCTGGTWGSATTCVGQTCVATSGTCQGVCAPGTTNPVPCGRELACRRRCASPGPPAPRARP